MPGNLNTETEKHRQLAIPTFLSFRCFRQSRSDPSFQPSLCKPVYPKQRCIAQGSHVRAAPRKFVRVQGILHKHILEKRGHFIVYALKVFHRSVRWLKQRAQLTIGRTPARQPVTRAYYGRRELVRFISRLIKERPGMGLLLRCWTLCEQ
jgi:hypothetical protein